MLKQRIRSGEAVVGSFVFLACPEMVEMAFAGMDYVIIDTEHSPKDYAPEGREPLCESTVCAQRETNIHICDGFARADFIWR